MPKPFALFASESRFNQTENVGNICVTAARRRSGPNPVRVWLTMGPGTFRVVYEGDSNRDAVIAARATLDAVKLYEFMPAELSA